MRIIFRDRRAVKLAWWVSRVFDPILVIPVMLAAAVWHAFVNGERVVFLSFLILVDVLLPGFVLFWFVQKKQILSGWDVRSRKERVPLFVFVVLAHLVGVFAAGVTGKHPMFEYLVVFWLLTVVFAAVTLVYKISVHAGVMSALATYLVLDFGKEYALVYSLVLVVVWARVQGKFHRLGQAIAGALAPILLMPIFWHWVGLR